MHVTPRPQHPAVRFFVVSLQTRTKCAEEVVRKSVACTNSRGEDDGG